MRPSRCTSAKRSAVTSQKSADILPQSPKIQGRDGGPSGLVWGHSVWTFGDTILNMNDEAGTNWHHNSFSITDDLNASDNISGACEPVAATGGEERGRWADSRVASAAVRAASRLRATIAMGTVTHVASGFVPIRGARR